MNFKNLLTNFFKTKIEEPAEEKQEQDTKAETVEMSEIMPDVQSIDVKPVRDELQESQKIELCELIGQGYTSAEIGHYFYLRHKVQITPSHIYNYKHAKKWKEMIKEVRKAYLADANEVMGAHRKVRLDRAERIYDSAVKKKDMNLALRAIEHSRKEMEEKNTGSLNLTFNQYNQLSDEEIEEKRKQIIDKINRRKPKEIIDGSASV